MVREIKFRAWDNINKEMVYGYKNHNSRKEIEYLGSFLYHDGDIWFFEWNSDGECKYKLMQGEIMQYTGLKDKNGKEDYDENIWEVIYMNKKIRYIRKWREDWEGYICTFEPIGHNISPVHSNVNEDGYIIGNSFENPELLENPDET
jgi:hypothetical protein